MSRDSSNNKTATLDKIKEINQVEGFEPSLFRENLKDMVTGESRSCLPIQIKLAWFRLKYPEGKITVQVTPIENGYEARAKVYPNNKELTTEEYLAEAMAVRVIGENDTVAAVCEMVQEYAVSTALEYAGFGLSIPESDTDEKEMSKNHSKKKTESVAETSSSETKPDTDKQKETEYEVEEPAELSPEERYQQALMQPCPIKKFAGQTLGEVLKKDQGAIHWVATKYTGDSNIIEAAKLICEYALSQAQAAAEAV